MSENRKTNLKSRLPGQKSAVDIESFITGAETKTDIKSAAVVNYPWQEMNVRDDVLKVYNLRLPEPYFLKLKYIAEHTPDSMQKFCLDVLIRAIDEKVEQIT